MRLNRSFACLALTASVPLGAMGAARPLPDKYEVRGDQAEVQRVLQASSKSRAHGGSLGGTLQSGISYRVSQWGNFNAALDAVKSLSWVKLIVDIPCTLTVDTVVPSNVQIQFSAPPTPGTLDLSGHSLDLRGQLLGPQEQALFFGIGTVSLVNSASGTAWASWWSLSFVNPDGTVVVSQTKNLQAAVDSGAHVLRLNGTTHVDSTILLPSHFTLEFDQAQIVASIPSSVTWMGIDINGKPAPQFPMASVFANRNGYNQYMTRSHSGTLVGPNGPSGSFWNPLTDAVDTDIHFVGVASFTTDTLDYMNQRGSWNAISMLYVTGSSYTVPGFTINWIFQPTDIVIQTDRLNGLFTFESAFGTIDSISGQNIQNAGSGGVALVGFLSSDLHFSSVTGWKNFSTFTVDGAFAKRINVDSIDAGDDAIPGAASHRHVEFAGCQDSTVSSMHLHGGGTYQALLINTGTSNVNITGTIENTYREAVTIQHGSNNSLNLTIKNPWVSSAAGYVIDSTGAYTPNVSGPYRPSIFTDCYIEARGLISGNSITASIDYDSSSHVNYGFAEGFYQAVASDVYGNSYALSYPNAAALANLPIPH